MYPGSGITVCVLGGGGAWWLCMVVVHGGGAWWWCVVEVCKPILLFSFGPDQASGLGLTPGTSQTLIMCIVQTTVGN